jgi:hypothetical protein
MSKEEIEKKKEGLKLMYELPLNYFLNEILVELMKLNQNLEQVARSLGHGLTQ